jgi:hypothetical protein
MSDVLAENAGGCVLFILAVYCVVCVIWKTIDIIQWCFHHVSII